MQLPDRAWNAYAMDITTFFPSFYISLSVDYKNTQIHQCFTLLTNTYKHAEQTRAHISFFVIITKKHTHTVSDKFIDLNVVNASTHDRRFGLITRYLQ